MNTIDINRALVTTDGGTTWTTTRDTTWISRAHDGFILEHDHGDYGISDGRTHEWAHTPTDALNTYADFIETFIDDQDEATRVVWQGEIDTARALAAQYAN